MQSPTYAIYFPPVSGLPFLAVTLNPDGTVFSKAFATETEASTFNQFKAADELKKRFH